MVDVSVLVHQMHETLSTIQETIASLNTTEHDAKLDALEDERSSTVTELLSSFQVESDDLARKRQAERDEIARRRREEDEEREARRRKEDEELSGRDAREDAERQLKLDGEKRDVEEKADGMMDQIEEEARIKLEAGRKTLAALEEKRKEINRLIDEQLSAPLPTAPMRRRTRAQPRADTTVAITESKTDEPMSTKAKEQPSNSTLGAIIVPDSTEFGEIVRNDSSMIAEELSSDETTATGDFRELVGGMEKGRPNENEKIVEQHPRDTGVNSISWITEQGSDEEGALDQETLHSQPVELNRPASVEKGQPVGVEVSAERLEMPSSTKTPSCPREMDDRPAAEETSQRRDIYGTTEPMGDSQTHTNLSSIDSADGDSNSGVLEHQVLASYLTTVESGTAPPGSPSSLSHVLPDRSSAAEVPTEVEEPKDPPTTEPDERLSNHDDPNAGSEGHRELEAVSSNAHSIDKDGSLSGSSGQPLITSSEIHDCGREEAPGEEGEGHHHWQVESQPGHEYIRVDANIDVHGNQCIPGTMSHGLDLPNAMNMEGDETTMAPIMMSEVISDLAKRRDSMASLNDEFESQSWSGLESRSQTTPATVVLSENEPMTTTSLPSTTELEWAQHQSFSLPEPDAIHGGSYSEPSRAALDEDPTEKRGKNYRIDEVMSPISDHGNEAILAIEMAGPEAEPACGEMAYERGLTEDLDDSQGLRNLRDTTVHIDWNIGEREDATPVTVINQGDSEAPREAGGVLETKVYRLRDSTVATETCDDAEEENYTAILHTGDGAQITNQDPWQASEAVNADKVASSVLTSFPTKSLPEVQGVPGTESDTYPGNSFRTNDTFPKDDVGRQESPVDTSGDADGESCLLGTSRLYDEDKSFGDNRGYHLYSQPETNGDGNADQGGITEQGHKELDDKSDSTPTDQANFITLGDSRLGEKLDQDVTKPCDSSGEAVSATEALDPYEKPSALNTEDFPHHLQQGLSPLNTATVHGQDDLFEDDSDNLSEYSDALMDRNSDGGQILTDYKHPKQQFTVPGNWTVFWMSRLRTWSGITGAMHEKITKY